MGSAIGYRPAATVGRYLDSDAFLDCIVGPIGSGKSAGSVVKILRRVHRQAPSVDGVRRSRWLVGRNSYRELRDTTLPTFFDWVPRDAGVFSKSDMSHVIRARGADGVPVSAEVLFRSFDSPDDVRKLLSLELTGFWFNEAREINGAIIDAATGRVGRYPRRAECSSYWYGGQLDSNPSDRLAWLYRNFRQERPEGWALFEQPGGRSAEAENLENLPPGYYDKLAAGKSPDWIAVYVDGEWAYTREGLPVFPIFNERAHVPLEPIPWRRGEPIIVGLDFGLTPAAAILQKRASGGYDWIGEVTTQRAGALQFARELRPFLQSHYPGSPWRVWGDPAGMQAGQADMTTCYQVMALEGIEVLPAPLSNNFMERTECVRGLLAQVTLDGAPGLRVSRACQVGVIGMGGGYRYRTLKTSDGDRHSSEPEKNHYSHVCEGCGYALMGEGEGVRAQASSRSSSAIDYRRTRRATAGGRR